MRWIIPACLLAVFVHARAEGEATPEPAAEERIVPQAYAFDRPELLADQLTWGIAHGARLLALACVRGGHAGAAEAWVDWQEREAAQIGAMNARLGLHYFQREAVPLDALALALGLKPSLELSPETLNPACTSLAEALAQPRYDLAVRRAEFLKNAPR